MRLAESAETSNPQTRTPVLRQGATVVVLEPAIGFAVSLAAVRYAWDNYPEGCNLYNSAGLPAALFRTDRWPYEY
jgi:hypothetical protein